MTYLRSEYAKLEQHLLCLARGGRHRINSGSVLNSQAKNRCNARFF
jgi:hypothetical protein